MILFYSPLLYAANSMFRSIFYFRTVRILECHITSCKSARCMCILHVAAEGYRRQLREYCGLHRSPPSTYRTPSGFRSRYSACHYAALPLHFKPRAQLHDSVPSTARACVRACAISRYTHLGCVAGKFSEEWESHSHQ